MHTSLTEVSTLYLDSDISMVSSWFLPLSLVERLLLCLVFWKDSSNFLAFSSHDLETSSTLQKGSILHQYLISESLKVFQPLFLLLLFCNPLFFGLHLFPCFLSCILSIMGLHYFFQTNQEPLLLLMPLLYFIVLLFEYFSVILKDVRGNGEKHCDTEERDKNFSFQFIYCWPRHNYRLLWVNLIELQRFSPKRRILSYTKSTCPEYTSLLWYYLINI